MLSYAGGSVWGYTHPKGKLTGTSAEKAKGATDQPGVSARNAQDCVRSREKCHGDIEAGQRSTSTLLIAIVAHNTKSQLVSDAPSEPFTNNPGANRHLSYEYRAPYKLPNQDSTPDRRPSVRAFQARVACDKGELSEQWAFEARVSSSVVIGCLG